MEGLDKTWQVGNLGQYAARQRYLTIERETDADDTKGAIYQERSSVFNADQVDGYSLNRIEELAPLVRLQAEGRPYLGDGGVGQTCRRGHRIDRPMGGVLGRGVQRAFDHLGHLNVQKQCAGARGDTQR